MNGLKVQDIRKRFNSLEILDGVSFEVAKGEVLAVIGASGSGKTTLLRCINRLTVPDNGTVSVDDLVVGTSPSLVDIRKLRKRVGYVFQQFNLWNHKTAIENIIEAPMKVAGINKSDAIDTGKHLLQRVGLEDKDNSYPSELSGGQQQRVALARALAMNPEVLLLDEITSALDPEATADVLGVIRELINEHNRSFVLVTHEIGFAKAIANKVIFLDQGKVVEEGAPKQVLESPIEERTKQFLKKVLI